jgi:hypothetical protein
MQRGVTTNVTLTFRKSNPLKATANFVNNVLGVSLGNSPATRDRRRTAHERLATRDGSTPTFVRRSFTCSTEPRRRETRSRRLPPRSAPSAQLGRTGRSGAGAPITTASSAPSSRSAAVRRRQRSSRGSRTCVSSRPGTARCAL